MTYLYSVISPSWSKIADQNTMSNDGLISSTKHLCILILKLNFLSGKQCRDEDYKKNVCKCQLMVYLCCQRKEYSVQVYFV